MQTIENFYIRDFNLYFKGLVGILTLIFAVKNDFFMNLFKGYLM